MLRHNDVTAPLDSKARRKQQDERRMRFRRAIESYTEQRQLHADEQQPDGKQQPAQCPQPGQNPAHGKQAPQAAQPVIGSATGLGDPGLLSQLSNHFARGGNSSLQSGNSKNQHSILFG